jgi:hypothetical protein
MTSRSLAEGHDLSEVLISGHDRLTRYSLEFSPPRVYACRRDGLVRTGRESCTCSNETWRARLLGSEKSTIDIIWQDNGTNACDKQHLWLCCGFAI